MRVLIANKFLHPKGGCETHLLGLATALGNQGHEIDFFGMEHPANVTPPTRTTTIPFIEYQDLKDWQSKTHAFGRMLFSRQAYVRMRALLRHSRPDVAHLHNIYHQLSPSVLVALRRAGVPCVLTAHDYKLVCPSYSLHDGKAVCFRCSGHRYWNLLTSGCSRQGSAGTIALIIEAYFHQFLRVYERSLGTIIAPSKFMRDRLVEGGFTANRVRVLYNAINLEHYQPSFAPGDYLLFAGRLSYEKGLPTLVQAARLVPEVPLVLVGDGPLKNNLEHQAADLPNLRFLGSVPPDRIAAIAQNSRAIVLASEVPENCPLCVLEGFAAGKPAIGSQAGGIPELVEHESTGLLVPPGNPQQLAEAMLRMWMDPDLASTCGHRARRLVEERHDLRIYTSEIINIYRSVQSSTFASLSDADSMSTEPGIPPFPEFTGATP